MAKRLKGQILTFLVLILSSALLGLLLANLSTTETLKLSFRLNANGMKIFMSFMFLITIASFYFSFGKSISSVAENKLIEITPRISIPTPSGKGEHGTARFMTKNELLDGFDSLIIDYANYPYNELIRAGGENELEDTIKIPNEVIKEGAGLVFSAEKVGRTKERYLFDKEDTHTLVIGATGSGKSRYLVMPSIFLLGLAGESMVITDVKKELFLSTSGFLNELGYDCYTLDFKNPPKSDKYNILQPVIDAVKKGDYSLAEMRAFDITDALVGSNTHNEKIWENGEKAVIAASILSIVSECMERPELQNLALVYWHIAKFAESSDESRKKKDKYHKFLKSQSNSISAYVASKSAALSDIAPDKTKGSFYTSAMITLNLFATDYMYRITSKTEIDFENIGKKKTALFIVLPDEKTTYYSIASLLVTQIFEKMVEVSDKFGGRLPVRVNFLLDEFGNFAPIKDFESKLTMGRSRGLRFNLFLQGIPQITKKYSKEAESIITSNCENWIYLQTDDEDTKDIISKKLGKYTIKSSSVSSSNDRDSVSVNSGLQGRELLGKEEIKRIERPYHLLLTRRDPAMLKTEALEKLYIDRVLGIGNKEEGRNMRMRREDKIPENEMPSLPIYKLFDEYWNVIEGKINRQKESSADTHFGGGDSREIDEEIEKVKRHKRLKSGSGGLERNDFEIEANENKDDQNGR